MRLIGSRWSKRMSRDFDVLRTVRFEVREDLLAALEAAVGQHDHRDRVLSEFRVLPQCLGDARDAVLAVVDHILRLQREHQIADVESLLDGKELDLI